MQTTNNYKLQTLFLSLHTGITCDYVPTAHRATLCFWADKHRHSSADSLNVLIQQNEQFVCQSVLLPVSKFQLALKVGSHNN